MDKSRKHKNHPQNEDGVRSKVLEARYHQKERLISELDPEDEEIQGLMEDPVFARFAKEAF